MPSSDCRNSRKCFFPAKIRSRMMSSVQRSPSSSSDRLIGQPDLSRVDISMVPFLNHFTMDIILRMRQMVPKVNHLPLSPTNKETTVKKLILQMQMSVDGFVGANADHPWQLWEWGDDNSWD